MNKGTWGSLRILKIGHSTLPKLKLKFFNKNLPYSKSIKFLGVTFDERLNFIFQSRLNIIKIRSNKKWGLIKTTLSSIYKSLIGSVIDYSFPCLNVYSEIIQNSATRSILKLKYDTPPKDLKLHRVDNRLFDLGENYIRRSLQKQVPLTCRLFLSLLKELWLDQQHNKKKIHRSSISYNISLIKKIFQDSESGSSSTSIIQRLAVNNLDDTDNESEDILPTKFKSKTAF
ncbi:RNA-directed DNA polymerase from mobile element [Brachionus plicatilis]|uniref:RNA-directed DNA polymerase from mobile element n=1 Tax=Brachionus plicatilis TaxID=10195 RepID=A0A3M7PU87_BRAPC|nr:RNA-directed DNA polymerase from mobile element [Brachionus plicatilis]